jgi:division/cell wall cluster transcriptional repressor MraZ
VFVGTTQRKLDDKGRIVLSAGLRDELDGLGYITVGDGCLSIFTNDGYKAFTDRVQHRVREVGDLDPVVLRKLASDSEHIRADAQGRVTLPAKLLAKVGIPATAGSEVVVNGALDRIEIWAPDDWAAMSDEGNDALQDAMRKGGL